MGHSILSTMMFGLVVALTGDVSNDAIRQVLSPVEIQAAPVLPESGLLESLNKSDTERIQVSHDGVLNRRLVRRIDTLDSQAPASTAIAIEPSIAVASASAQANQASLFDHATQPSLNGTQFRILDRSSIQGDECIILLLQEHRASQWSACSQAASLGCKPCSVAPLMLGSTKGAMIVFTGISLAVLLVFLASIWLLSRIGGEAQSDTRGDVCGGVPASFRYLELLRFLAALHILEVHFFLGTGILQTMVTKLTKTNIDITFWSVSIAEWGVTWVSFFFLLSGFVHMYNTGGAEMSSQADTQNHEQGRSWIVVQGWLRRAFVAQGWLKRAYPIHVFGLLVRLTLGPIMPWSWAQLFADLLLLSVWVPGTWIATYSNTPTWFLSVLFAFGFFFHLCYTPLRRFGPRGCVLTICACFALTVTQYATQRVMGINIFNISDVGSLMFRQQYFEHPLSHWQSYVAGMALAQLHRHFASRAAHPRIWQGIAAAFLTSCNILFFLFNYAAPFKLYGWFFTGLLIPIHASLVLGLSWVCRDMKDGSTTSQSRIDAAITLLGRMALPIYVLQVPVLTALNTQCGTRCASLPQPIWPCIELCILFTVSFAISRTLEIVIASSRITSKQPIAAHH